MAGVRQSFTVRPLDLDRGNAEKQRTRKIALAANSGIADGLLCGEPGEVLREARAGKRLGD